MFVVFLADVACGTDEYRCASGRCISALKFCDGVVDCSDNTDESSCAYGECGQRAGVGVL